MALNQNVIINYYDKIDKYNLNKQCGISSYLKRNEYMIDNSEYCIFYYNSGYLPEKRKRNKTYLSYYQPNSGTFMALKYAKKKNKKVIIINE